jgi:hypothetical protein
MADENIIVALHAPCQRATHARSTVFQQLFWDVGGVQPALLVQ